MRATRLYAHARGIFLLLRMREPIKKGGATALQEFPLRHCSAPMPGNFTGRCHRPILPTETRARRLRLRLTAHVTRLADDAAYRGGILPALPAGTGGDSASALLVPCPLEPAACPARSPCTSPNVPAALRRLHQSGGAIWPDKQPERLLWRDLSRGQGDCSCFGFRRFAGRLRRFSSAWLIPPRRWRFRLRQGRRPHRSPVHRHAPSMRGRPCATGQALPPGSRRSRAGTTTAGRS